MPRSPLVAPLLLRSSWLLLLKASLWNRGEEASEGKGDSVGPDGDGDEEVEEASSRFIASALEAACEIGTVEMDVEEECSRCCCSWWCAIVVAFVFSDVAVIIVVVVVVVLRLLTLTPSPRPSPLPLPLPKP